MGPAFAAGGAADFGVSVGFSSPLSVGSAVSVGSSIGGGGGSAFTESMSPATLISSSTTGSSQSEYSAPIARKCNRKEKAAMMVVVQSMSLAPRVTATGS